MNDHGRLNKVLETLPRCGCPYRVSGLIKAMFMPSQRRMYKLWQTFTAGELDTIASFLGRTTKLAAECAEAIGQQSKATRKRRTSNKRSNDRDFTSDRE